MWQLFPRLLYLIATNAPKQTPPPDVKEDPPKG